MARYRTITTEVEVDIDLEDFSDEDLIEELRVRGKSYVINDVTLDQLYDSWQFDRKGFDELFRSYCRKNLGKSF